jgi:YtxH-like protein
MDLHDVTDRLSLEDFIKLFRSEPDRWRTESLLGSLALLGAGALIGAAAALFFAPKPGEELRHDIGDQLRAAGTKLSETVGGGASRGA